MFDRCCLRALLIAGLLLPLASCTNSPSLTSIVISPETISVGLAPANVPQGFTQYKATGYYTHPNHPAKTRDITNEVAWLSSNPQVATITNSGLATSTGYSPVTGVAWIGDTTITAREQGFNGVIVSNESKYTVTAPASASAKTATAGN